MERKLNAYNNINATKIAIENKFKKFCQLNFLDNFNCFFRKGPGLFLQSFVTNVATFILHD